MLELIKKFFTKDEGLIGGATRSPEWPAIEKEHLRLHPTCAITGSTKKLNVHHIKPFHLHPDLELNPSNLITLSTDVMGSNIHLLFGHLGNFKSYNVNIEDDAREWFNRIQNRP